MINAKLKRNVTGTENNGKHDILYNSAGTSVIAIEEFNDFGVDQCENQYEDGNQGCCEDNVECLYNISGTENNHTHHITYSKI